MNFFLKRYCRVIESASFPRLGSRSLLFSVILIALGQLSVRADPPAKTSGSSTPVNQALEQAQAQFKKQNWADARASFDHARDLAGNWHTPEARLAVEGAVACSQRLNLWDEALSRAQTFVDENKGRFEEAVGERFLAGLYLSVPHQGTKQGGTYYRGQYLQGVQVSSFKKDRREAIHRYEHARDILAGLAGNIGKTAENPDTPERRKLLNTEQIGLDFDLVTALSSHEYDAFGNWGWCSWWWGSWEPEEDSEAVEEADYEQPRSFGRFPGQQEKPTGLPLDPDGHPRFLATPASYAAELGDGPKIRFLLEEVQALDTSEARDDAAQALFRQAMICRGLYGPDIIAQWNNQGTLYDRFGRPLPKSPESNPPVKKIWELADNEAIAIGGGRLQVVTLPDGESPLALLSKVETLCPKSRLVPEAIYTRGLYFQSRQQFPQALAEYDRLRQAFPKEQRSKSAQVQAVHIRMPGVMLDSTGVHLPGDKPALGYSYRNTGQIDFTARRFDLTGFINHNLDHLNDQNFGMMNNLENQLFQDKTWKTFTGKTVAEWSDSVPRNEANRTEVGKTTAPLTEPGAYIVEARAGADAATEPSRLLVLVTDIAILHKNLPHKGLIYVADARTGQPLANHSVRVIETWAEYDAPKGRNRFQMISTDLTTNSDGAIEYQRKQAKYGGQINAIVGDGPNRMAFSFFQNWNETDYYDELLGQSPRNYVITDRPVYRPNTTVRFRVWTRSRSDGRYDTTAHGSVVGIEIYDPKNSRVLSTTFATDDNGCVSGEYPIPAEAALGLYQIRVDGMPPDARVNGGGLFRVEEYKKPEFEVKVTPSTTLARLGDKVSARIEAKYYFGAPVALGDVSYKVYREDYHHVYWGPDEYDWLYGAGYGRDYYPYAWFPWWGRWGPFILGDMWPWPGDYGWPNGEYNYGADQEQMDRRSAESGTRHALRELVAQGSGQLKADGSYDVEFDTAPALRDLGDRDHRYTIEAEVRDASRRTITGQGDVKVTRQQFYAFAETRDGWYQPQEDAFVDVRTLTADNVPVATHGTVTVYRIGYDGPGQAVEKEQEVKSWDAETDADGRLSFKYPIPDEGQYRITYLTHDSWNQEVQANTVFWVNGPKFDGRLYRFNDLEIIADKRTYRPGDVAHLLVNTAQDNDRILFSDDVSNDVLRTYRFIDLPQRSTVIDVPVTDAQMPNFFVEATLVRNGQVHQESRELFVPPSKNLLNLAVETDKPTYKPGESGKVHVKLTDLDGKPVSGHVTLTAFDESITYIQDEFGPAPKVFFYGQRRIHNPYVDASLDRIYNANGVLDAPENMLYLGGMPDGWQGFWQLSTRGITLSGFVSNAVNESHSVGGYLQSIQAPASEAEDSLDSSGAMGYATAATSSVMAGSLPTGMMEKARDERGALDDNKGDLSSGPQLIDPTIRSNFADTALWVPDLVTDETGRAETTITFPDSLTTWRLHGYALTPTTQVGDGISHATTTKNLLVRLESPRFFIERDEAVLSANVHNYLTTAKTVTAELILPAAEMQSLDQPGLTPDKDGNLHLTASADVDAKGEHRFDWPVKMVKQGLATVTVKALTDEESDAMQMAFPVLVHGINKMVAQGGSYRVGDNGTRDLKLNLPAEIDPEQTKLEVTLSPSLGGVMIDALPYLAGYPYGCVEQTMSRFYPSVLVRDTLKKMGTDLETVGKQRKQMYPPDLKNRFGQDHNTVFDTDELNRMVGAGLQRIVNFQHDDGGWGWWAEDDSSPFETAYVIQGLQAARAAGVDIDGNSYQRGLSYLQNSIQTELAKPKDKQDLGDQETQAYVAYILVLTGETLNADQAKWLDGLYDSRGDQNNYGKALLALTFKLRKQDDRAALLLQNILQFAQRDDSNETAWIRTPQEGWWFWWNNDIETNAWVLKALVAIDPKNDLSPRIVKWLLNNRKNGTYWRSTRDTAQVIAAMVDYMRVSGEADPNYHLTVKLDGQPVKDVTVTKDNFFTFDNRFVLYGLQVSPGPHVITLVKNGSGALYYSAYLSYFTKEEDIKGAGNEILVTRDYYLLKPKTETVNAQIQATGWNWWGWTAPNPAGQEKRDDATAHVELRSGYDRIPLKNGDAVTSGDQIEVVLKIHSKNTYDYLAFEDMKPAGCEPVDLRSGGRFAGGLCPNVELRDDKVVFFIGLLEQGDHILRYKLRAETPGTFHALPTSGYAMYAPEVRAISDEMRLKIEDK
jgi:alpha-2-macroglobulin